MVLGVDDPKIYTSEGFQSWFELAGSIRDVKVIVGDTLDIIDSYSAITHAFTVGKDTVDKVF